MRARTRAYSAERRTVYLLAAVNLVALGSLTAPVVAAIPLKIDALLPEEHRASALATVLTLGGLAALLANPLFGALSDRTRSRWGKRRPWMLGGTLAGLVGVAALAVADSLPAIIVSWLCTQTAYNAVLASAAALLADIVPDSRRAAASGVFTAAAFVGTLPPLVLAALLPRHVDLVTFAMPLVALIVVGFALSIRESTSHAHARAPKSPATSRRGIRIASFSSAFAAVWLQRLAMQSAFSLATAFTIYLIIDRMTKDPVDATPIAMIATLAGGSGIVIGAAVGGAWASRVRRYLPFLVCGALGLAAGAATRAFADAPIILWIATTIGGLAVGAYLTVNLALAMRVIPGSRAGTYLGVLNVAETIPQVLAPMVAAALLRVGQGDPVSGANDNYLVLYGTAAAVALLSLATLPVLRRASAARVPIEDESGRGSPEHLPADR
ncbi:MFS transporter [Microbacterium abyssi]|uniref:MFS transporter n=1 Tax=Microbacterium abyssi TaxID=2782166 RepID=UPI0018896E39|nr:MFS transporter [Microbacterium sp. A18JL241]